MKTEQLPPLSKPLLLAEFDYKSQGWTIKSATDNRFNSKYFVPLDEVHAREDAIVKKIRTAMIAMNWWMIRDLIEQLERKTE